MNGTGMIILITGNEWLGIVFAMPLIILIIVFTLKVYKKYYYVKPKEVKKI